MGTILKYMIDNWPVMAIIIILLYLAIVITWKGAKYHHEIKTLNTTVGSNTTRLEKISVMMTKIGSHLANQKSNNFTIEDFIMSNSPYSLSDLGKELFTLSKAEEYLDNNFQSLLEKIKTKDPKNGLDLENYSIAVLNDYSDTDYGFEPIKKFVYNNPVVHLGEDKKAYTINLQTLILIMSIWVRDKYYDTYHDGKDGDFTPKA